MAVCGAEEHGGPGVCAGGEGEGGVGAVPSVRAGLGQGQEVSAPS